MRGTSSLRLPRRERLRGRTYVVWTALVALVAVLSSVGIANAWRFHVGNLILRGDAGFSPRALPRSHDAPIRIHQKFSVATVTGNVPPVLESITYLFDRHGRVDITGLPVCTLGKLEATDVAAARHVCSGAILGKGTASAIVSFPEQAPNRVSSPITLFNGPKLGGRPTVLAHAYTNVPVPTTFIVPVVIETVTGEGYGYRVIARIPKIAGGAGHLVALSFRIGRTWSFGGRKHSYINARCKTGHLRAGEKFRFTDNEILGGGMLKPCTMR